ncbi:MAG: GDSL-type esterase/lipase family protein [Lachnospiraceae bacterium]|nr:GDSL-type esterase/lipase family protein [Lachnospiraceae bacterium]
MKWYKSWNYLSVDYQTTIGTVADLTQRTWFRNNLRGDAVRLFFSNQYSSEKLEIAGVSVGKMKGGVLTDLQKAAFGGRKELVLQPGESCSSDELALSVKEGEEIVVSCYFEKENVIRAAATTWSCGSWHTSYGSGDQTAETMIAEEKSCGDIYPYIGSAPISCDVVIGLTEIWVRSEQKVVETALFGDSITHMSYYSDQLAELLYERFPGQTVVTNKGYGGNRLLRDASWIPDVDGHGANAGKAGLQRFEGDVYGSSSPEIVCVLEGTNDLMHPYFFKRMEELPETEELSAGMQKLAAMAHQHGSKVMVGTVPPMLEGEYAFGEVGEKRRNEYNSWVLSWDGCDGALNFAEALANPEKKELMAEGLHIGDGLHPNLEGGRTMSKIAYEKCAECIEALLTEK